MFEKNPMRYLFVLCFLAAAAVAVPAQEYSFNYFYSFARVAADEPPQIGGVDIAFPETARKNGVEGTLSASLTLGEDGRVRDLKIVRTLPHGVEEAVLKGLQNLAFQPARLRGKPVAVPMNFDFVVAAVYDEDDKNVAKPKILEKPAPVYPAKYAAEKVKGRATVLILCFADGRVKTLGVDSTLPREFDRAALDAAAQIRFQPAVHKKSRAAVAMKMRVEYDFKP